MARPLRIEYEGAWYHIMNSGVGRRPIFTNDVQRQHFLSLLGDAAERFNAEWYTYCLMENHYHLLIRTPDSNLQRIMHHINVKTNSVPSLAI
jgi:REP element-mobilizing transposase RayT